MASASSKASTSSMASTSSKASTSSMTSTATRLQIYKNITSLVPDSGQKVII